MNSSSSGFLAEVIHSRTNKKGVGENCEFAAISYYMPETVQQSAEVTIECEYEVICALRMASFAVSSNDRSITVHYIHVTAVHFK